VSDVQQKHTKHIEYLLSQRERDKSTKKSITWARFFLACCGNKNQFQLLKRDIKWQRRRISIGHGTPRLLEKTDSPLPEWIWIDYWHSVSRGAIVSSEFIPLEIKDWNRYENLLILRVRPFWRAAIRNYISFHLSGNYVNLQIRDAICRAEENSIFTLCWPAEQTCGIG